MGPRRERKESWYIRKGLGWAAVGDATEDLTVISRESNGLKEANLLP